MNQPIPDTQGKLTEFEETINMCGQWFSPERFEKVLPIILEELHEKLG